MSVSTLNSPPQTAPVKARRKRLAFASPALTRSVTSIPPLINGDALDADEFMRRYEASPDIRKAELIDGVVYIMASPVSTRQHGKPHSLTTAWLEIYGIYTRGVSATADSTAKLGIKNIPQPDASLYYLPERNGKSKLDSKGYLEGPPELVVEISASSASIDTHKKFVAYQAAGVQEYIIVLTETSEVKWWCLENGRYQPLTPGEDGILRSRVFPGLWLDSKALLKGDGKRVMTVLKKGLKSPEHQAFAKLV